MPQVGTPSRINVRGHPKMEKMESASYHVQDYHRPVVHRGRSRATGETEFPDHLGRRHRHREPELFSKGMMGYRTPNINRIAEEDFLFTDSYGEQS